MTKARQVVVATLIMISFWLVIPIQGQEKKDDRKKGYLPANYGKLGLSIEQKQKIYAIQAKYKEDLDALNKKVKKAQEDQRAEIFGVLSGDQKEKLREIIGLDKKGADPKASKKDGSGEPGK